MRSIALCLLLAPGMAAAQAQTVRLDQNATLLSLSVTEQVQRTPDLALFNAGVTTQAKTAREAMAQNATRMAAVVAALKRAGIADRDIQTAGLSLQPQYYYHERDRAYRERVAPEAEIAPPEPQAPRIVGYQAGNSVNVRVRRLAAMGEVIDALVAQGANQINGPQFTLDDPAEANDEARRKAVATALSRADLYAKAAGLRLARIVSINEGGGYMQPSEIIVTGSRTMAPAAPPPPPPPPVATGEVATGVTISVQFALER